MILGDRTDVRGLGSTHFAETAALRSRVPRRWRVAMRRAVVVSRHRASEPSTRPESTHSTRTRVHRNGGQSRSERIRMDLAVSRAVEVYVADAGSVVPSRIRPRLSTATHRLDAGQETPVTGAPVVGFGS